MVSIKGIRRGIGLGSTAVLLGASTLVGAAVLGVGAGSAQAAGCSGGGPVSIVWATGSTSGPHQETIRVTGCGLAGQPVTVTVYGDGSVWGQGTATTSSPTRPITSPPNCLPQVGKPDTCKIVSPGTPGGAFTVTVTLSPDCFWGTPFTVVADQPGTGASTSASVPNVGGGVCLVPV
jgi:hypothetical protein